MRQAIKKLIKSIFGTKTYKVLANQYRKVVANICQDNLNRLAGLFGSDKYGFHFYTEQYMKLFSPLRKQKLKILEIGIGGFEDPDQGGASLLAWQYFFPNASIYGIDLYDKTKLDSKRIKTFKGSQVDRNFLTDVINNTGRMDIIIDDGSHIPIHQVESFKFLFPYLNDGGYYVVEDTLSSYNPYYDKEDGPQGNFLNFAKSLTDYVNFRNDPAFLKEDFETIKKELSHNDTSSLAGELEFVSFYEQMVIIKKK